MPAPRILIVEDETKLLEHLADLFREDGFSVFTCSSYKELENSLQLPSKRFDIVLLDRLLQGRDSAEMLTQITDEVPDAKILVLSAINTAAEKASLLNLGAEDYVAKPFDSKELLARVHVLLRRNRPEIRLGNVLLDSDSRSMLVNDQDVPLTNKEFVLLRTLLKTPGKIYNKVFLYERVWEMNSSVDSNVVESTINKLRRRLEDARSTVQIKNARNVGYWVEE
jgi:two-component system copper resistance phosphate regulon response regulator CusR